MSTEIHATPAIPANQSIQSDSQLIIYTLPTASQQARPGMIVVVPLVCHLSFLAVICKASFLQCCDSAFGMACLLPETIVSKIFLRHSGACENIKSGHAREGRALLFVPPPLLHPHTLIHKSMFFIHFYVLFSFIYLVLIFKYFILFYFSPKNKKISNGKKERYKKQNFNLGALKVG